MTKRQLPPRSNRGKNTFYTREIDKDQYEKTKVEPKQTKKSVKSLVKDEVGKKGKMSVQSRRQVYNQNKKNFRFTRGIHYFYDLNKLQRVPQSVSYAFFPSKKESKSSKSSNYTISYSKDCQKIGSTKISSLINRNIIGLPLHIERQHQQLKQPFEYNERTLNQVLEMKRHDKNQCHHYLFQVEDKKNNLDRMILQLEFIYKKVDFYLLAQNIDKLHQFSMIERDSELSQIFFSSPEIENSEKKQIIQYRIDALKQKRQNLNKQYENISETYFSTSLNQKIFNQVKNEKQKLNRFNIYREMEKNMRQHRLDNINVQNPVDLKSFHHFNQESSYSRNSQMDDYFCIDQKAFDHFLMENTFKIISIRLFHEGQNCFYFAKKIFLKLFNRQLRLQKQIRSITTQQYKAKLKEIEESLQRLWKKKDQSQPKPRTEIPRNIKKNEIKVKINERIFPIDFYEYYCLKIFTVIYDALAVIQEFLKRSENKKLNVIQHLASLNYSKFQNRFLNVTQNPQFGLLAIALDKLVEVITQKNKQFQSMNYQIFVQFIEKNRQILTFVKQIQSSSVSESQITFKRSISQILSSNRQDDNINQETFQHGRKMIK